VSSARRQPTCSVLTGPGTPLPAGYGAMMMLATIPPLWRRVIDHYGGGIPFQVPEVALLFNALTRGHLSGVADTAPLEGVGAHHAVSRKAARVLV
jgi:hypothetical protein